MLTQGKEIAALDFASIIGGPLVAVVNAQAMAARTTTSFIQSFAFDASSATPKLKAVEFDFSQVMEGLASSSVKDDCKIKVPLLTIIPIPFIRVDTMTIEFNVNLHSTSTTNFSNDFTFDSGTKGIPIFAEFSGSISDKSTFQQNSVTDDTYSMKVTVHAVQDQMPGGMGQVLSIFSNVIQSQAGLIQTIVSAQAKKLTDDAQKKLTGDAQRKLPA